MTIKFRLKEVVVGNCLVIFKCSDVFHSLSSTHVKNIDFGAQLVETELDQR